MTIQWALAVALVAIVAYVAIEAIFTFIKARLRNQPAQASPLDELIRQEHIDQAMPLVPLIGENLPVDVKAITLVLYYNTGERLHFVCKRPERMSVEP